MQNLRLGYNWATFLALKDAAGGRGRVWDEHPSAQHLFFPSSGED